MIQITSGKRAFTARMIKMDAGRSMLDAGKKNMEAGNYYDALNMYNKETRKQEKWSLSGQFPLRSGRGSPVRYDRFLLKKKFMGKCSSSKYKLSTKRLQGEEVNP